LALALTASVIDSDTSFIRSASPIMDSSPGCEPKGENRIEMAEGRQRNG
jgi:hypothetical protein